MKISLPILILGYERSGTTLVRRLLSMCPVLKYEIVHEKWKILVDAKTKEEAIQKLTFEATQAGSKTGSIASIRAGQKVPYVDVSRAKLMFNKFRSFFPNSTVVHVSRNPVWAINSQVTTFKVKPAICVHDFFCSVPSVLSFLSKQERVVFVRFEDIVNSPMVWVALMFASMGYDPPVGYIDRVISTRDPWTFDRRVMPGLRYFDSISCKQGKCLLSKRLVQEIERKEKLQSKLFKKWVICR